MHRSSETMGAIAAALAKAQSLWAKREAQLNAVIAGSAGFYGDLQGIAGQSIPDIESLSPLLVEDKTSISALEQSNDTRD